MCVIFHSRRFVLSLLSLCLLTFSLTACASRQERQQLESADFGLILLSPDASRPLPEEIRGLFTATVGHLDLLPTSIKGWLSPLAPALKNLEDHTLELAQNQPQILEAALSPYRSLGRYPVLFEQVKVPADLELAPVVTESNQQLKQAWRASAAVWLATGLEPLLRRETLRLLGPAPDDPASERAALGAAAVSQLYLLLQARASLDQNQDQTNSGLLRDLEQSERLVNLRRDVLKARLQAQPGLERILADDIQLLGALQESLRHARSHLGETERRLETSLIQAGDRVQAVAKSLHLLR